MREHTLVAFICSLLLIVTSCSTAMKVGYTHKPLAAEGCEVSYSISQQSKDLFIIVSISSDRARIYRRSNNENEEFPRRCNRIEREVFIDTK